MYCIIFFGYYVLLYCIILHYCIFLQDTSNWELLSCPGLQALCARRQTESHQFQRGAHLERQLDTSTVNPKAKCMGRVGHFADSLMTGDAVFMSYHVKTIRFDAREIQFQDICSNLLAGTVSKTSDAFGDGDRDRCSSCMEKQGEKEAFHQFLVFAKKRWIWKINT